MPSSLEVCAGAGGTALGLEAAGFRPLALVDSDNHSCATLRLNRPEWKVVETDLRAYSAKTLRGRVDLLSGGVPCPPFSVAGKRLGAGDERDLFPEILRLVRECRPNAVLVENVRGLLDPLFDSFRTDVDDGMRCLGYIPAWNMLNASDFSVPQLRPRVVLVALRPDSVKGFSWPQPSTSKPPTVGEALYKEMSSRGWAGAEAWRDRANGIAPTLVGGSRKHGGPDLGPTRARKAWAELGVEGVSLANDPPPFDHVGPVRLTVRMTAILQGFPADWQFAGGKTAAYRQVGNAFPPPVAEAVARQIRRALRPRRASGGFGK